MGAKEFKLRIFKRAAKPRSKRMREGSGARTSSTVMVGAMMEPITRLEFENAMRSKDESTWGSIRFVGTLPELSAVIKEGTLIFDAKNIAYYAYYDKKGSRFVFAADDGTYYTHANGSEMFNDPVTQKARVHTYYISNKDEIFYYDGGSFRQLTNHDPSTLLRYLPMPITGVTSATLQPSSVTRPGEVWYLSNINRFAMKVDGKFYGGWPEQLLYQDGNTPYMKMYYSPNNIYFFAGTELKVYK